MTSDELHWFKSSYSGGSGDSCVEVAGAPGAVHVRDSKSAGGPELGFDPGSWAAFVNFAVASGETA
ncbi:DUF397 domain-containing protein [Streptomyces sp. DSM 42041]|uniref:DUF397 domain-containing protein n=1 Tax=Streptomyces hazeniae TaxID=3075538 RepID=A0ABU2NUQ5_9ACTN|nr:DUF397 domain-containing protein [Streptomyces sp. DSM 42041]MDT0380455.1 DUF397 domain-containing protein [Streptomyces sp. DSM 42041]